MSSKLKKFALVPVHGAVVVVKMPFVLIWGLLVWVYALISHILSLPAYYASKSIEAVRRTWRWTKGSTKPALPWRRSTSISAVGTQTRVETGYDFDEYLSTELTSAKRPPSGSERKKRKKAIVSSLIRVLLESSSPPESEEESDKGDCEDKIYQLVRELVQFSKSGVRHLPVPTGGDVKCPILDLETLKQHAKDKEKLLTFISELDQYVAGMDSAAAVGVTCTTTSSSGTRNSGRTHRRQEEDMMVQELPDRTSSMNTRHQLGGSSHDDNVEDEDDSEKEGDDNDDLDDEDDEESVDDDDLDDEEELDDDEEDDDDDDEYEDTHLSAAYYEPVRTLYRGLSPLVEVSPELGSANSTESVKNCQDLESELNAALSHLNDMTEELNEVEEFVIETHQTTRTETVTEVVPEISSQEANVCVTDTSDKKQLAEKPDTSYEDACDDFSSIPKSPPTLGIQVGHERRDLASARNPRPPTLPKRSQVVEETVQVMSDDESEESDHSDKEYDDDQAEKPEGENFSHSLSDQFKLLDPASLQQQGSEIRSTSHSDQGHNQLDSSSQSCSSPCPLYATVNKKPRPSSVRSHSEGTESSGTHSSSLRRVHSFDQPDDRQHSVERPSITPERSLFIHDRVPPWKQMRSRTNSGASTGSPAPTTPLQTPAHSCTLLPTGDTASQAEAPHSSPNSTSSPHTVGTQSQSYSQAQATRAERSTESASPYPHQAQTSADVFSSTTDSDYDRLPNLRRPPPPPLIPSQAGMEGIYDSLPKQQYLHERVTSTQEVVAEVAGSIWTPELPPRNSKMRRTISADTVRDIPEGHVRLSRSGSERRSSSTASDDLRKEHRSGSSSSVHRPRSASSERDHERRVQRERSSSTSDHHHHSHSHHHHRHRHHSDHSSSSHRTSSEKRRSSERSSSSSSSSSKPKDGISSFWKILASPSSSKGRSTSRASKEVKVKKDGKKQSSTSKGRDKEQAKTAVAKEDSTSIPRNESGGSLQSGVSVLSNTSSSSSGRESLV